MMMSCEPVLGGGAMTACLKRNGGPASCKPATNRDVPQLWRE